MAPNIFTNIANSKRNMGSGINSKVRDLAIELIKLAYHKGIYITITSGYRSNAEQTRLYNQGRTTPGSIVTNAKAGQSIHNYGLAIDYALMNDKGVIHWDINRDLNSNQVRDWFEVAAIGKKLGFQWGGDWKSFRDYPHLDMQRGMSLSNLAKGSRPSIPSVPKRSYLGIGDNGSAVKTAQTQLTKAGFKTETDGYFGDGMTANVKAFQKKYKLAQDGFVGPATQKKLTEIAKNPTPAKPASAKPKEEPEMKYEKNASPSKSLAPEFKRAVDNGITDGTYPNRPATRAELAVMVNRAYEKALEAIKASK